MSDVALTVIHLKNLCQPQIAIGKLYGVVGILTGCAIHEADIKDLCSCKYKKA